MRKEDAWKEDCIKQDTKGRKGAEKLTEKREKNRIIQRKKHNSKYWLEAAENLVNSNTPQGAIVLGYFAIESKAEEALAHKNYKVNTHICTIKGVSRVLELPELATEIQNAYQKRKDINYNTQLEQDSGEAKYFIENHVKDVIKKLEDKIEDK